MFLFYSCSKECSWVYDRYRDRWDYKCDPVAFTPTPPAYPVLVSGEYYVKNYTVEYIPDMRFYSSYDRMVEDYFKNYAVPMTYVVIEKQNQNSFYAQVYGLPNFRSQNANHSNGAISFNGISSYQMPSNFRVGNCSEGLSVKGNILLNGGKPTSGTITYSCQNETILVYTFSF